MSELKSSVAELYDDDGRPKRQGTLVTTTAHIITAVVGSGVLSLPWAMAQLGWVAGPMIMLTFAMITYFTSTLLADSYRTGPLRNRTYMDAVRSNLGGIEVNLCGCLQYLNLFVTTIGYTIAASLSMKAIVKANCFHVNGRTGSCASSSNSYMIAFGMVQIIISQIPGFPQISWLSIVSVVMSFTYSSIGVGLGIAKVIANESIGGNMTGVAVGSTMTKVLRKSQALGDMALAFAFSMILLEIQDTIKSPNESQTMKRASMASVGITTLFYALCACSGYGAYGDASPGNLLTGFGFYEPFWVVDIANAAVVVHMVGAYQVFSQPLFAFVESKALERFPNNNFMAKDIGLPIPALKTYRLSLFRLLWRTFFVILTTVISMTIPFFNDVAGILGALGFWPLTVYFPTRMYIRQKKIPKWSKKWVALQILIVACLVVSVAAAIGSVAGVAADLKAYRPFVTVS